MVNSSSRQRREQIIAEVLVRKHVAARDLAQRLEVSEATVRRDLKALSDQGQVELVYGGATLKRASEFSFHARLARNVEAKRIIGRLAAELVNDGDQIFLDSGTTCFELARCLKGRHGLSVIVNSARLALELESPGLSTILLGGQYRPERMDSVGPLAISTLEQLRGYRCFVGADGVSRDFGLSAADIDSADLYRRAVKNARETILLVDRTKFDAPSLFKIVDWDALARVVTDQPPAPAWAEFLAARGVEVTHPALAAVEAAASNESATP